MRSLRPPHPTGWLHHKALSTGKSRWLEGKGTGPFRLANYAADGKLLGKNGKVWWHCLLPKANFGACSNKTLHKEEQQSLSYLHNYSLMLGSQVNYLSRGISVVTVTTVLAILFLRKPTTPWFEREILFGQPFPQSTVVSKSKGDVKDILPKVFGNFADFSGHARHERLTKS